MTDQHMAPQAFAAACRRRDDVRRQHEIWCRDNASRLAERPSDLAKGIRSFALQQVWDWAAAGAKERFAISNEAWALFRRQWVSQTRRLRYGPVEGLTQAEWKAQMETIENEYWPKRSEAA
jgi:hypothetical protein